MGFYGFNRVCWGLVLRTSSGNRLGSYLRTFWGRFFQFFSRLLVAANPNLLGPKPDLKKGRYSSGSFLGMVFLCFSEGFLKVFLMLDAWFLQETTCCKGLFRAKASRAKSPKNQEPPRKP